MASQTQWTGVWVNSGSWRWTGRPGVLQSMGLQRVGHDWVTELNWILDSLSPSSIFWSVSQALLVLPSKCASKSIHVSSSLPPPRSEPLLPRTTHSAHDSDNNLEKQNSDHVLPCLKLSRGLLLHFKTIQTPCEVKWSHTVVSDSLWPMDCSRGSSVHGIFQARVLEWVAISFSRGSSSPRDWTQVSCLVGRRFTIWATREV